jgi:hypothetical protein
MVNFSFSYQPEDLREIRLVESMVETRRERIVILCSGPALIATAFYLAYQGSVRFAAVFGILGIFQLSSWPLLTWWAKRSYRKHPHMQQAVAVAFSRELIEARTALAESKVKWELISRFKETENLLMFYAGSTLAFWIPKRVLTKEQISDIRQLTLDIVRS